MTTQLISPPTATPAEALRGLCGGAVHLPGDAGYDAARTPWNVAVDLRPAAVAYPADAAEVAAVVRAAAAAGLRVAAQATGHNAGAFGDLHDVVLVRTSAMTAVTVDAAAGRVRVQAGALWLDVVDAAAQHGLAVLHGSSPDVGVLGYSLGGGIGWFARALGMAANSITAAEVVTADGAILRVDADHHPDLFWALRGGGGNIGVVTELELRTFPVPTAYAGMMLWDWAHAARVLPRWADWARSAPDSVTTSFRLLQVPPLPDIPDVLRGRQLVVIDGAVLGTEGEASDVLAPLRQLAPEIDTFGTVPSASLVRLHMDPEGPTPAVSDTAVLAELSDEAIDAFLRAAGPGSGSSLAAAELRQLGGALSRPAPDAGALPRLDGEFILFAVAIAATPDMAAQGSADAAAVVAAMDRWRSGSVYLNFVERPTDAAAAYEPSVWARLQQVRAAVDPAGLFVANHRIPPTLPPRLG